MDTLMIAYCKSSHSYFQVMGIDDISGVEHILQERRLNPLTQDCIQI